MNWHLCGIGMVLLALSGWLWWMRCYRSLALIVLTLGTACLRYAAAHTPFLYTWDEQFHVLVVRSLQTDPLRPMLFVDDFRPHDDFMWVNAQVWLHKPPFSLWVLAFSQAVFGADALGARTLSVLLQATLPLAVYAFVRRWYTPSLGFGAAWGVACSFYLTGLVSGRAQLDHNDTVLLFFMCWSWVAFAGYTVRPSWLWVLLCGGCVAGAILTKWLVGAWVLGAWAVWIVVQGQPRGRPVLHWLAALLVVVACVSPWHLYMSQAYPRLYAFEMAYNTRHFTEALEGHHGTVWYHLTAASQLYFEGANLVLLPALVVASTAVRSRARRLATAAALIALYGMFTFAATKMPQFTLPALPFVWAGMALLTGLVVRRWHLSPVVRWLGACVLGVFVLNIYNFYSFETGSYYLRKQEHHRHYLTIARNHSPHEYVLFGVDAYEEPSATYFSHLAAFAGWPTARDFETLEARNQKALLFGLSPRDSLTVPDSVRRHRQLVVYALP
jgi:4-amino-4-deoxy-L-arabinose transferase